MNVATLPTSAASRIRRDARRVQHERIAAERPRITAARGPLDWLALILLLAAAMFIFFWNLSSSGYANEFYSAAAQAGSQSWEAFLWGGLDAGGAITVDKPPASLWLMALSVRLLGLSSFAILLPQALMGVACTYLLYALVRRAWGNPAGIVAGIVFITTPMAALMFRFNNPDALLILLMLSASGCVLRGLELPCDRHANRCRTRWYALAGACIGFGFLTKQFQVLLVLPGFALAMFALSPTPWPRRLLDAVVALGSMTLAAGWWIALTVIVPSGSRPYFGGSQTDSFIELTFGYNGLGRLTGNETGSVIPGAGYTGGMSQGGMWGETGFWRLWTSDFGDQITWIAPLAFAGIVLGLIAAKSTVKGQALDGKSQQNASVDENAASMQTIARIRRAQAVVFGGWLVVTWLVFSFMAGIFHAYYTVALAPAIAVLVSICLTSLYTLRDRPWALGIAGLLLAANAAWDMGLIMRSGSYAWLGVIVGVTGVICGLALCALAWWHQSTWSRRPLIALRAAALIGLSSLMVGPILWTVCTISTGHTGSIVTAGPSGSRGNGSGAPTGAPSTGSPSTSDNASEDDGTNSPGSLLGGGGEADQSLVELLTDNASNYRWAAATTGSQNAARYQLASELPVMAIGGFNGSDPAPTLDEFKAYVAQGLVKYYIANGEMGGAQMGGSNAADQIATWVTQNYTAQTIGNVTVYDLQE